jgi:hypothetical protein
LNRLYGLRPQELNFKGVGVHGEVEQPVPQSMP